MQRTHRLRARYAPPSVAEPPAAGAVALPDGADALDDLRFIRQTMERAAAFTAVSGGGLVLAGAAGTLAAVAGSLVGSPLRWLAVWVAAALLSVTLATWANARKARAAGLPVWSPAAQKFVLAFAPSLLAGALLTGALARGELYGLLPGVWLLLYGAAVAAGGAFSVRLIPLMGALFMSAGAVALLLPLSAGNVLLGAMFGGVHVIFGLVVARRYGG